MKRKCSTSKENGLSISGFTAFGGDLRQSGQASQGTDYEGTVLGKENFSPKCFCPKFLNPHWGHGRPHVWVIDVCTQVLVLHAFEGQAEVFDPGLGGSKAGCLLGGKSQ